MDRYGQFKFVVSVDGRVVAGLSRVSDLAPALSAVTPVVLERGVSYDAEFVQWATTCLSPSGATRRDVTITLLDERGERVMRFMLRRCWVTAFDALPDLDGRTNAVAISQMVLRHEGWERENFP